MHRTFVMLLALLWWLPAAAAEGGVKAKGEPDLSAFGGWKPQPVENPPEQEVRDFLERLEIAQDPESWASLVTFPVMMVTTDSQGVAVAMPMDREGFMKTMEMDPAAQEAARQFEHGKAELSWVTPSVVFVNTPWSVGQGKHRLTWRSAMLLVKKADGWRVQGMAEGGWADQMPETAAARPPSPSGQ